MAKHKYISIDSFNMQIRVIVDDKEKKALIKEMDLPSHEILGMAIETEGGGFILVLPKQWDESTVWHESHHMARFINAFHGIETTYNDHEADAYLMEYIVKQLKRSVYKIKT